MSRSASTSASSIFLTYSTFSILGACILTPWILACLCTCTVGLSKIQRWQLNPSLNYIWTYLYIHVYEYFTEDKADIYTSMCGEREKNSQNWLVFSTWLSANLWYYQVLLNPVTARKFTLLIVQLLIPDNPTYKSTNAMIIHNYIFIWTIKGVWVPLQ